MYNNIYSFARSVLLVSLFSVHCFKARKKYVFFCVEIIINSTHPHIPQTVDYVLFINYTFMALWLAIVCDRVTLHRFYSYKIHDDDGNGKKSLMVTKANRLQHDEYIEIVDTDNLHITTNNKWFDD